MPQGRRKLPFSGKKKKEQILLKRQVKAMKMNKSNSSDENSDFDESGKQEHEVQKVNAQPFDKKNSKRNRYTLQFHQETERDLALMKEEAKIILKSVPFKEREVDASYFAGYDFPIRPEWHYDISKEELNRNEMRYFTEYIKKLENHHYGENKPLSLFELNLETWLQLWRVLELSDILLVIVDVRYGALMFPPSLYTFITRDINKKLIILLNKIDLVPPEVVVAWKHYFLSKYPDISIVCFASYPASNFTEKKRLNLKFLSQGAYSVYKACKSLINDELNINQWEQKILEDMAHGEYYDNCNEGDTQTCIHEENYDFDFKKSEKYKDGILTIGCIGFPNVGKSSVINALKGRKVVSVSRTPGHTKHFQTIFLTKNVKLCDCPGLVFPSSVPKYIQVILGSYPIAQLRVPYPTIKFIGERINLVEKLGLTLPDGYEYWSALAICEAWARKRGFLTAKSSRPDLNRAANHILRLTLSGKINIVFYPPNYFENEEMWQTHSELEEIKIIQFDETTKIRDVKESIKDSDEGSDESELEESESDDVRIGGQFDVLEEE